MISYVLLWHLKSNFHLQRVMSFYSVGLLNREYSRCSCDVTAYNFCSAEWPTFEQMKNPLHDPFRKT